MKIDAFWQRHTKYKMLHEKLIELIKTQCVYKGNFPLANGGESDYYINIKKLALQPEGLRTIVESIKSHINEKIDLIAGPALGAAPIVVGCIYAFGIEGVIVRKNMKTHGTGRIIEGPIKSKNNALLVEDVTTTGKSLLDAAKILHLNDITVIKAISVLDREMGAKKLFKENNIEFDSLVTISEVL